MNNKPDTSNNRTKEAFEKSSLIFSKKLYDLYTLLSNTLIPISSIKKMRDDGTFRKELEFWKHFYEEECRIQGIDEQDALNWHVEKAKELDNNLTKKKK